MDWPLGNYIIRRFTWTSIIGTVLTPLYTPDNEHHGLVLHVVAQTVAGGAIPAADALSLAVDNTVTAGQQFTVARWNNATNGVVTSNTAPLIGSVNSFGSSTYFGARPEMILPGFALDLNHTAAAAGVNWLVDVCILEKKIFEPLPLRFS